METIPEYNGWPNKPTWAVKLWIDNEQSSYNYWHEQARECVSLAPADKNVAENIWTVEQCAKYRLGEQLRDEIEQAAPTNDEATMYSDLMNWALAYVNWDAIAKSLISDLED